MLQNEYLNAVSSCNTVLSGIPGAAFDVPPDLEGQLARAKKLEAIFVTNVKNTINQRQLVG